MAFAQQRSRAAPLSDVVDLTKDNSLHEQGSFESASQSADAAKAAIMSQALQAGRAL